MNGWFIMHNPQMDDAWGYSTSGNHHLSGTWFVRNWSYPIYIYLDQIGEDRVTVPSDLGRKNPIAAPRAPFGAIVRSWVVLLFLMATELRRCGLC